MSKSKSGKKDGGAAKGPAVPPEDEEGYSNFSVQDDLTNVILIVEGKKLYVHRSVVNWNPSSAIDHNTDNFFEGREGWGGGVNVMHNLHGIILTIQRFWA